ncbi:MAG TPA: hypothetical protein VGV92_08390 [Gammaproteobacteria bacterium]|nr:hypothetical protein [Gammaproteobacteria bacterium]
MEDLKALVNSQPARIKSCGNSIIEILEVFQQAFEIDQTLVNRAMRAVQAAINNDRTGESLQNLALDIRKRLGVSQWKINTGVGLMVGGLGLFAGAVYEATQNNFSWPVVLLWMAAPSAEVLGGALWTWGSPAAQANFCRQGRSTIESDLYKLSKQLVQLDKELVAHQRRNEARPLTDSTEFRR